MSGDNAHPGREPSDTTTAQRWLVRRQGIGVSVAECSRGCLIRLIEYPELPLRLGVRETIKTGRSSLVVRAEMPIGPRMISVAYKRFRRRNWWKRMTSLLRRRRAVRAWRLGHAMRHRGIATPRPLVAIVPRALSREIDSFLVTEWIDGCTAYEVPRKIADLPESHRPAAAKAVAEIVGRLLGRMHAAGFSHRDLKPGNVMIAGEFHNPESLQASLVDLDGVTRFRFVSRRRRATNLARLAYGFAETPGVTPALMRRCLAAYLENGSETHWHWKDCWKAVRRAVIARRKKRLPAGHRAA